MTNAIDSEGKPNQQPDRTTDTPDERPGAAEAPGTASSPVEDGAPGDTMSGSALEIEDLADELVEEVDSALDEVSAAVGSAPPAPGSLPPPLPPGSLPPPAGSLPPPPPAGSLPPPPPPGSLPPPPPPSSLPPRPAPSSRVAPAPVPAGQSRDTVAEGGTRRSDPAPASARQPDETEPSLAAADPARPPAPLGSASPGHGTEEASTGEAPEGRLEASPPDADAAQRPNVLGNITEAAIAEYVQEASGLIASWQTELAGEADSRRAARLHYELGRLLEHPLQDFNAAAEHYQEALLAMPSHLPSLRGARRALLSSGNLEAAVALFDTEIRAVSDPRQEAVLYYQKGRLLEDQLGRLQEAEQAYRSARQLDGDNPTLLKAIEQIELKGQAWDSLANTYEHLARAVGADSQYRSALTIERAHLIGNHQSNTQQVVELLETSIELEQDSTSALTALKQLHQEHDNWRELIPVLEQEIARSTDPVLRTVHRYRLARMYADRLGRRVEALSTLEAALADTPDEQLILRELAQQYEKQGAHANLTDALARWANTTSDPQERMRLFDRLGRISEEELGDSEGAASYYQAALEIDPRYLPSRQALERLHERRGNWQALLAMRLAAAEAHADPSARSQVLTEVAELYETRLGQPDKAAECHERALTLRPTQVASLRALERLHWNARRFGDLAELYVRLVEQETDEQAKAALLLSLGSLQQNVLTDPGSAADTYERALALPPTPLAALHGLQRAHAAAGRYAQLIAAIDRQIELITDQATRAELMHEAAMLLDTRLADREAATERLLRVIELDPEHDPTLRALARLYEREDNWPQLLAIWERRIACTDEDETKGLLLCMAETARKHTSTDDALACYQRLLERDPDNGDALTGLARILRDRCEWSELVAILERQVKTLSDPRSRALAWFDIAEIHEEHLGDQAQAVEAYRKSTDAVAGYRPSLDALERLHTRAKNWRALADDVRQLAGHAADPSRKIARLAQEGRLWMDKLDDMAAAIRCFEAVLEHQPDQLHALVVLETLYHRAGLRAPLVAVYKSLHRQLVTPAARCASLRELARLASEQAGDVAAAQADYQQILRDAPDDFDALLTLEALAIQSRDIQTLYAVDAQLLDQCDDEALRSTYLTRLAESLEVAGEPSALEAYRSVAEQDVDNLAAIHGLRRVAELLDAPLVVVEAAQRQAAMLKDPEAASAALLRSGSVRQNRLNDPAGAAQDFQRVLELNVQNEEAAERLVGALGSVNEFGLLIDLLSKAASTPSTPETQTRLWRTIARVQAEQLGLLPEAIESVRRGLAAAPQDTETALHLVDLFLVDERYADAALALREATRTLADDPQRLKDVHLRLARLYQEELDDPIRAENSYRQVLELDERDPEALGSLMLLCSYSGRWDEAADLSRRLAECAQTPAERASALVQLSALERQRGDTEQGTRAMERAVALLEDDPSVALPIKELLRESGDWAGYDDALRRLIPKTKGRKGALLRELASVEFDELRRPKQGFETLRAAVVQQPDDPELRMELAGRLSTAGQFEESVGQLQELLRRDAGNAEAWRCLVQTYRLWGHNRDAVASVWPLAVLGAATQADQAHLARIPPRPARALPGSLGPNRVAELAPAVPRAQAAEHLLAAIAPALGKVFPPNFDAFQTTKLPPRSGHPLRALADQVASILGAGPVDVYLAAAVPPHGVVQFDSRPAIVLPKAVTDRSPAGQAFLLAQHIAPIARGLHPLNALGPEEIKLLLGAAARLASAAFGAGVLDEQGLSNLGKSLSKALGRRGRKAAEPLASAYVQAPELDLEAWTRATRLAATRAALLVADDLRESVAAQAFAEGNDGQTAGPALVRSSETLADLMRFWISEQAQQFRHQAYAQ